MKTKKEPFVRIAKRNDLPTYKKIILPIICVIVALAISVLYLWIVSKQNPFVALKYIWEGTFQVKKDGSFNQTRLWSFLQEMLLLLGISLGLTPAFRMRFWNIGAQGQLLMGGLVTATIMIYAKDIIPSNWMIVVSLLSAIVAGGIWGLIPAIFKAKWNTNETLFTLMMNYVAVLLVTLCCNIWRGKKSALGIINQSGKNGWFPTMMIGGQENAVLIPLIIVFILVALTYVYIRFTKQGYEIQVVGQSVSTARYTGINVGHVIRRTMFISGAICGFVGFLYVSNFSHTISALTGSGYGFTAIIVCWLSHFNPLAMVGYSSLIIFLDKGANNLANVGYSANLNQYSSQFIVFVIILAIMVSGFVTRYRLQFRNSNPVKTDSPMHHSLTKGLLKGGK